MTRQADWGAVRFSGRWKHILVRSRHPDALRVSSPVRPTQAS